MAPVGQFHRQFRSAPVDRDQLRGEIELLQPEPAGAKGVAFDQTGPSLEIFPMHLLNQFRLLQIKRLVAGMERLATLMEQCADRPVSQDEVFPQAIEQGGHNLICGDAVSGWRRTWQRTNWGL